MLGKDVRDIPPGCLRMHIYEYTCACGNQWTHSETWGKSPTSGAYFHMHRAHELDNSYKYTAAVSLPRRADHCFKCLPLKIKLGEITTIGQLSHRPENRKVQQPTTAKKASQLSLEDI